MIIAKNLCRLRKSQTSGGRSRSSQVMRQSSSMRQSASTGPSRNACSSAESFAGGKARSFCQLGLPLKSSPSHHTSPASIASRSVAERRGKARRAKPKMGLVIQSRRKEGSLMQVSARVSDSAPHLPSSSPRNRGDGPPEMVGVLGVPIDDVGVRQAHVEQREQAGTFGERQFFLNRELARRR